MQTHHVCTTHSHTCTHVHTYAHMDTRVEGGAHGGIRSILLYNVMFVQAYAYYMHTCTHMHTWTQGWGVHLIWWMESTGSCYYTNTAIATSSILGHFRKIVE